MPPPPPGKACCASVSLISYFRMFKRAKGRRRCDQRGSRPEVGKGCRATGGCSRPGEHAVRLLRVSARRATRQAVLCQPILHCRCSVSLQDLRPAKGTHWPQGTVEDMSVALVRLTCFDRPGTRCGYLRADASLALTPAWRLALLRPHAAACTAALSARADSDRAAPSAPIMSASGLSRRRDASAGYGRADSLHAV